MFTQSDVNFVINYTDRVGDKVYYTTNKGQLRFIILREHINDFNRAISRPIVSKEDVELLKTQVKKVLRTV